MKHIFSHKLPSSYLIFIFFGLFFVAYTAVGGGFLADDNQFWEPSSFMGYFKDPNIFSRPFNGIFRASLDQLAFNRYLLIGVSSLLIILQYLLFYRLIQSLLKDKLFAILATFLSFIFIYSTSTLFSPTMIVSSVPICLFFGACLLLKNKEKKNYFIAGILILIGLLCYEVVLFLLPFVPLLFFKKENGKKDLGFRYLFVFIIPVLFAYIYKKYIGGLIFDNYVEYTDNKINIGLSNTLNTSLSIIKTYFLDTIFLIKRGIYNISGYNFIDFLLLLLSVYITIYLIRNINIQKNVSKWVIYLSLILFLLCNLQFYVSNYSSIVYGFENRTLGLVRFSWGFLVASILYYLIGKLGVYKKIGIGIFTIISILFSITIISEKNAWVKTSDYTQIVVQKFINKIPTNLESNQVFVCYDKSKLDFQVADEQTLKADYEFRGQLKYFGYKDSLFVLRFRPKNHVIDKFFGKEFNKREKTILEFDENGELIHDKFKLPFYIYNYEDDKLYLIKNKEDYILFDQTLKL